MTFENVLVCTFILLHIGQETVPMFPHILITQSLKTTWIITFKTAITSQLGLITPRSM